MNVRGPHRNAALALALLGLSASASAFPFWLQAPTRSNPHDPKSAQYVAPASTAVVIAPYNSPTLSPTPANTPSFTRTPTPLATNSPVIPPTATRTFTSGPSPTMSATPTVSATATRTATQGPTFTSTLTLTPGSHTSLICDFEQAGTNDRTLWNGGPVLTGKDGSGSTLSPNPFGPADATSGGAYGSSGFAGCFSGTMVMQNGGAGIWPYCFMAFELIPGGTGQGASTPDVDVTAYSPNNGFSFDYKAAAAGVQYRVKLASSTVTDGGFYEYLFTPADTAWHTMEVWFPGTAGAPRVLAQPGWAATKAFDKTHIGGFLFEPVQSTTAAVAYGLCIDNLTLAVTDASTLPTSTPTPTAVVTHGALIADFESVGTNDRTLWNDGPVLTVLDSVGSTNSKYPWGATSATAGGAYGASSYAGCYSGTMVKQDGAASIYPYTLIGFELLPGGTAPPPPAGAGVDTDISAYCPNNGFKFDYKAGAAGVDYRVKLTSTLVTDFGYYEYIFTSVDTAWHTLEIWFPGTPGAPRVLAQPGWAAAKAFDKTKIGGILFEPVQSTSAAVNYDLCIDNLTFAVSAAPTPVATPTFGTGTMIADFEDNFANDVTLAPFGQSVSTGSGSGGVISPSPWDASSGTAPGANSSSYAGCISGSLPTQVPPTTYPYAVMELLLAASGWGNGGGSVNITPYAPSKRIIFDYKAAAAGVQYSIQLVTQDITDYGFYEYFFTPANTGWNTLVVYFPDSPYTPRLAQSFGTPKTWAPNLAGEIIIRPVPQNSGPVNFGLCIDNLRFD